MQRVAGVRTALRAVASRVALRAVASRASLRAVVASLAAAAAAAEPRTVNGLYPLWEHTGEVHDRFAGQVGFAHAQIGLGPAQIGTQPFLDLYGTANAGVKAALWRGGRLRVALGAAWYRVPTGAESRTLGNLHTVHLVNPYAPITLVSVPAAATFVLAPRVQIHASAAALAQWSEDVRDRLFTSGAAAVGELRATRRWAAMLHAGHEGFPAAPQTHVALSFAYRLAHLDLRAGYARRFEAGESSGAFLFDGALVF